MQSIISCISDFYPIGLKINKVLGTILSIIVIHKAFYFVIGMFFTRKFKPAKNKHKYGICIAARNEEKVIERSTQCSHGFRYLSWMWRSSSCSK